MEFVYTDGMEKLTDEEVEKGLREEGSLVINEFKFKNQSLKEVCEKFFELAHKYVTYTQYGYEQCRQGKNRSISDLYRFAINYLPETTIAELKDVLKLLIEECRLLPSYCSTIRRGVFYHISRPDIHNMSQHFPDGKLKPDFYNRRNEFGYKHKEWLNL